MDLFHTALITANFGSGSVVNAAKKSTYPILMFLHFGVLIKFPNINSLLSSGLI